VWALYSYEVLNSNVVVVVGRFSRYISAVLDLFIPVLALILNIYILYLIIGVRLVVSWFPALELVFNWSTLNIVVSSSSPSPPLLVFNKWFQSVFSKLKKCLLLEVNFLLQEDDLIWSAWTCLQIQWSTIQWLYVVLIYFICCRRIVIVASSLLILIQASASINNRR